MMGFPLANWIEENRNIESVAILRQIIDCLDAIHSRGEIYGCLTPQHVLLDDVGKTVISIQPNPSTSILSEELLEEWRPANEEPSQKGDIFSLGCLFGYVLTRGQHPFGKTGQRASFIAHHLYDLTGCRDKKLQKLIARMISPKLERRPLCADLKDYPLFWNNAKIDDYFNGVVENMNVNSDCYKEWSSTILFPSKHVSSGKQLSHTPTTGFQSVTDILKLIKVSFLS